MWIRVPGSWDRVQKIAAFPSSQLQAWLTATRPRILAKAGGSGQGVRSLQGYGVTILLGLRRHVDHLYLEEGRGVYADPTEAATADCRETVSDAMDASVRPQAPRSQALPPLQHDLADAADLLQAAVG